MTGDVQASMAFVAVNLPVTSTDEPCRTRPAPAATQCCLDKCTARSGRAAHSPVRLRYIYTGSRSCITLRYPMHMCWVAELCNPALPYAYLLGREAV